MAYDQGLAQRIRELFAHRKDVEEKKMFGGLCFMLSNHMCCGVVGDRLMVRVGPDKYEASLGRPYAKEMDFTGRPLKGMVYVEPQGFEDDASLKHWLDTCVAFVDSLPPKDAK